MRRAGVLFVLVMGLTAGNAAKEWLREVEIKSEPAEGGAEMHYTVRITPDKTVQYDRIVFEMVYHQEFPWTDSRGRKSTKIHEPVTFQYRRNSIKLVDDLDAYISFRVPYGRSTLEKKYGEKVFNKAYPISVTKIRISGVSEGKKLWEYELLSSGKHKIADVVAAQNAKAEKEKNKKEDLSDITDVPDWLK